MNEAVKEVGLELRAGLHTGECEIVDGKVGGIAVHIGARITAQAEPGEVFPVPSGTSARDRVSGFLIVAWHTSRAFPVSGACTVWTPKAAERLARRVENT